MPLYASFAGPKRGQPTYGQRDKGTKGQRNNEKEKKWKKGRKSEKVKKVKNVKKVKIVKKFFLTKVREKKKKKN